MAIHDGGLASCLRVIGAKREPILDADGLLKLRWGGTWLEVGRAGHLTERQLPCLPFIGRAHLLHPSLYRLRIGLQIRLGSNLLVLPLWRAFALKLSEPLV